MYLSKKKKLLKVNYCLNYNKIVKSSWMFGHEKKIMNSNLSLYFLCIRNNLIVFNMIYIFFELRYFFSFILQILFYRIPLGLVNFNNSIYINFLINKYKKFIYSDIYSGNWVNGSFTNFKWVNKDKNKKKIPSLVFLFSLVNNYVLKECYYLNILTCGIVDSNIFDKYLIYSIKGNDNSIEVIYYFLEWFKVLSSESRIKEKNFIISKCNKKNLKSFIVNFSYNRLKMRIGLLKNEKIKS